jgi:hypothetical protein
MPWGPRPTIKSTWIPSPNMIQALGITLGLFMRPNVHPGCPSILSVQQASRLFDKEIFEYIRVYLSIFEVF